MPLEGWWTDLALEPEDVDELYRQHATSEQFHSEFKTDLDLERLPSGKFATNALVMALAAFAYNILRFIGQTALIAPLEPVRHSAKRRRLRTVIQELMYLAGQLRKMYEHKSARCRITAPSLRQTTDFSMIKTPK
jgi:hypothetical protein